MTDYQEEVADNETYSEYMELLRWKLQWDYDPRDLEPDKQIKPEYYRALSLMLEEHDRVKKMGENSARNIKSLKKQMFGGVH